MSILLVRHGETALNAARTLQPADTPLSERGLAQAHALAQRLAEHPVSAILSSDLPRALQTAQAVGAATGLPVQATALLRERDFGDLRGQPYDALGFNPLAMEAAPPGGESAEAFRERVGVAFAHMVQACARAHGDLVVVTHGLVIRALVQGHLRLASDMAAKMAAQARIGNTSVTAFCAQLPHEVTLLDCTQHLDAAGREAASSLSGG